MNAKRVIVVVVTSDYIPYAATLAASIFEHDSSTPVIICVADLPSSELPQVDGRLSYVSGGDLGIKNWKRFAFQYEAKELAAALKSHAVGHLLERGFEKVVLLDSDIQAFQGFDSVFEQLDRASLLVTPHLSEPFIDNGHFPSAQQVRLYGVYNTGFMGFRSTNETKAFVDWWKHQCNSNCIIDIPSGIFVDQSWVDLAPCFVSGCRVVRKPGWNVGYWNLRERRLSRLGTDVYVNKEPLIFFHFSGFDSHKMSRLSKFSNRDDFADQPLVAQLAFEYGARLNEEKKKFEQEYRFNYLSNGVKIRPEWRQAIRTNLPQLSGITDPFELTTEGDLIERLENAARTLQSEDKKATFGYWKRTLRAVVRLKKK